MNCKLLLVIGLVAILTSASEGMVHGQDVRLRPTTTVDAIKVVADKAPDCSSLKAIVQSVTRGCKTNDEKAIALYNFLRLANYHLNYPSEKGGISSLKLINVYGWSLCGGLHTVEASLWREMGWKWRYIGWSKPGHTTVEAFYDGQWHYLDTFLKFYAWKPDSRAPGQRTIASQEDIRANPELVTKALVKDPSRGVYYARDNRFETINDKANFFAQAFFVCGDTPEGVLLGVRNSKVAGSQTGWNGIKFDSGDYSTDVNLSPGQALTLTWDAVDNGHWWGGKRWTPRHSCGDKEYRNCSCLGPILEPYRATAAARGYANGQLRIACDFRGKRALQDVAASDNARHTSRGLEPSDKSRPASITLRLSSPYILTLASGQAGGSDMVEVSIDEGKTFKAVALDDFTDAVQGKYDALVRLTFSKLLTHVTLNATVQCNRCSLPYLSPGRNTITVSARQPSMLGDNWLVVTYAYRVGSRSKSYEDLADGDFEVGRGHHASWSDEVTVVRKRYTARQLPATFEIDVPTPKDRSPVYPRMVFLRREIVSDGADPVSLPRGSVPPRTGPNDALKTLPNPFLVGVVRPPKRIIRPTTTRRIKLPVAQVVGKDGGVFDDHFLKWNKDASFVRVLLVGGKLDLPDRKQIAAARLILPVTNATPQSPTKVGAMLLKSPFESGQSYDFSNLGNVLATTVVPKQPDGQPYKEPREFSIDVSRAVKRVAAGDAIFRGFGVRTIQDRGVDDGWTVRLDLSQRAPIVLEIDVYAAP